MAFQSQVRLDMTSYIVGEIALGGPLRAEPKILNSTSAANNVFGRAFQQVTGAGNDLEVTADLTTAGVFAGIMVNPKEHVTAGTSSGALEPTLTLQNNESATLLKEGTIVVSLTGTGAVNIGDQILFDLRTGELSNRAPSDTAPPANFALVPNGNVVRCNVAANTGRVVLIHLNG